MSNILFYEPTLKDKSAWLDWRGNYPGGFGWRHDVPLVNYRRPSVHHSVTAPKGNAKADVDFLWQIHRNNGWGGIGYNFVVTSEEVNGYAKVAYVGDIGNARAHTPNQRGAYGIAAGYGNNHIIAICIIGSFHTGALPTEAQRRSTQALIRELIFNERGRLPNIPATWDSMREHCDFDFTQCAAGGGVPQWQAFSNSIINAPALPAPQPPTPPPVPPKPEWEQSWSPYDPAKKLVLYADTNNVNFVSGALTPLKAGTPIDVGGEMRRNGSLFYRTVYSTNAKIWAGIPAEAFVAPEPPKVDPVPIPPEPPKHEDEDVVTDYPDGTDAQGKLTEIGNKVDTANSLLEKILAILQGLVEKITSIFK